MSTSTSDKSLAKAYLTKGDNAINSMTTAATSGTVAAATGVTAANKAADSAATTADKLNAGAASMKTLADSSLPNAARIESAASTLSTAAANNTALAQPWLRQSQGLLAMDETAGGISGEFASLYRKFDPTLQAAQAAANARSETQAQADSAVRVLQRAGVSPTASALADIRKRAIDSSAALVAAAKTTAMQTGISLQMEALQRGLAMAIQQSGVGENFLKDAASNTAAAATAEAGAASIKQGVASIYGSSENLVANAQQLIQQAANGQISANSELVAANAAVANSFTTAAEYYSIQASSFRGLAESADVIGR